MDEYLLSQIHLKYTAMRAVKLQTSLALWKNSKTCLKALKSIPTS